MHLPSSTFLLDSASVVIYHNLEVAYKPLNRNKSSLKRVRPEEYLMKFHQFFKMNFSTSSLFCCLFPVHSYFIDLQSVEM